MSDGPPAQGGAEAETHRVGELLEAGRFDEAIALQTARVARAPGDPGAWAVLAGSLFAARRPEASLDAWTRALALSPRDAALLCGKANVLRSLSRVEAAAVLLRQALAADPGSFDARFGLALMAVEAGDWIEAEALVAPLIARRRDAPPLAWLGARIALGRGDFTAARDRITGVLADRRIGAEQRADALLLLGEALDGLGLAGEAFAAVAEGKAIQHRLYAQRAAGGERETAKLRRLGAWLAAADPADWLAAPAEALVAGEADAHVFLLGFPRSGTTLLEQALAGHPGVAALEEAPTLAQAHDRFLTSDAGLERLAHLSVEEAQAWRAHYWRAVAAQGVTAPGRLFLDKAPAGTLYLPLIARLFPRARVLFALRDPRDVTLSCLRNAFQMNAMTYEFTDLQTTAACYDACMGLAQACRAVLPTPVMEVRHEALVADLAGELRRIAAFLGLEVRPEMMDVAGTARRRNVRTPSAGQVRAGLNTRGLGRWRAYAADLAPVLPVLAPWVARFGYPPA
jgi:thioredoxin-like negative regulator of GroEL